MADIEMCQGTPTGQCGPLALRLVIHPFHPSLSLSSPTPTSYPPTPLGILSTMQPNQWQQQQYSYNPAAYQQQQQRPAAGGYLGAQQTGFPGAAQQQRPMATGFPQQQQQQPMGQSLTPNAAGTPTGGAYSFLNAPPPAGSFGPRGSFGNQGGMTPQMTGYPGAQGGMMAQRTGMPAGGMMSQPTGMPMGMMSQPTGMHGGLMSQPTGMPGGGLRAQPTGIHDPRLGAMMQTFMPSNMSQVS